jgi:hypothetical protein
VNKTRGTKKYEKWENVFLWKAINKVQIMLFVQAMKPNEQWSFVYPMLKELFHLMGLDE